MVTTHVVSVARASPQYLRIFPGQRFNRNKGVVGSHAYGLPLHFLAGALSTKPFASAGGSVNKEERGVREGLDRAREMETLGPFPTARSFISVLRRRSNKDARARDEIRADSEQWRKRYLHCAHSLGGQRGEILREMRRVIRKLEAIQQEMSGQNEKKSRWSRARLMRTGNLRWSKMIYNLLYYR